MQAYDLIMLIVLGIATILGAIKGFAWQIASLASIIVSYLVSYRFRFQVAEMIHAAPPWNLFLAMLILYVGSSFVIWVGFRLLSGAIDKVRLKEFDRHLGTAFGLTKGLIYCLLITMFAMSLLGPKQQTAICQSKSGYYIAMALDKGVGILPKEIHDVVGPYLTRLDEKLKDGRNGAADETGGTLWGNVIPGLTGGQVGAQTAGQPGSPSQTGWDLGSVLPQIMPGAATPQGSLPEIPGSTPQYLPQNFPPLSLPTDSGLPTGWPSNPTGATPYLSPSAQQQGYVLPR